MTSLNSRACAIALLLAPMLLALAGCESLMSYGKKIDYKAARSVPDLQIPPNLSKPVFDDRFVVAPPAPKATAGAAVVPSGERAPATANVRLAAVGSEPVVVASMTPETAWNLIRDFWGEHGFVFSSEQPALGIMDTDWAENLAKLPDDRLRRALGGFADKVFESDLRDRFRTRIERGLEPGSIEVYVIQYSAAQVPTLKIDNSSPAGFVWAPVSPDVRMRDALLQLLMVKLGAPDEVAATSIAARAQAASAAGGGRARLETGAQGSRLVVDDDFERAWRRIGLALDRSGFTVIDRDQAKGLFYVRLAPSDAGARKDRGWLSRLQFWQRESGDAPQQYRVLVNAASGKTIVSVQDDAGSRGGANSAESLLLKLRDQLT